MGRNRVAYIDDNVRLIFNVEHILAPAKLIVYLSEVDDRSSVDINDNCRVVVIERIKEVLSFMNKEYEIIE